DVLGERMLEAVHQLGFVCAREDKVEAMQIPEMSSYELVFDLEDARDQRDAEASPYHCRALERLLERIRDPVDAGRDDVVDGCRNCHVGTAQPRLALLDDDPARFQKLTKYLLHVQRIPLALLREDLEELFGDLFGYEKSSDHPAHVGRTEAFDGNRLRQGGREPRRRVARPCGQHEQNGMAR